MPARASFRNTAPSSAALTQGCGLAVSPLPWRLGESADCPPAAPREPAAKRASGPHGNTSGKARVSAFPARLAPAELIRAQFDSTGLPVIPTVWPVKPGEAARSGRRGTPARPVKVPRLPARDAAVIDDRGVRRSPPNAVPACEVLLPKYDVVASSTRDHRQRDEGEDGNDSDGSSGHAMSVARKSRRNGGAAPRAVPSRENSQTLAQPTSVTLTYAPQPASNHCADVQCLAVGLQ